jgi:general nucleoside transport system permease protein
MTKEAFSAILMSGVAMAVPLLLAALGELVVERAGVINVGLEGMMLVGAFAGVTGAFFGHSPWLGLLAGVLGGLGMATVFALVAVSRGADQVVAGTALNLLALGATGAAFRSIAERMSVPLLAPSWPPLPLPGLARLPVIGEAFFDRNLLTYASYLLVAITAGFLFHSRWGLALRAVGESPGAADTMGINVAQVRWIAILWGGVLAGSAGVFLSIGHVRTFSEDMIAGRGFIALAVVIFGRWNPWGVAAAAGLFGLAQGFSYSFQALNLRAPYQLFLALPYLVTLAALIIRGEQSRGPAALAQPYRRS